MSRQTKFTLIAVILFGLILLVGCSDDEPVVTPPPIGPPPYITPEILMNSFKEIYEEMDTFYFEDLLHADYRMILLQETIDAWEGNVNPLTWPYFDRDSVIHIHRNMFEGLDGVDQDDIAQAPIDSIRVAVLDKDGPWELVEESEEYFGGRGAYKAHYNILIFFECLDNHRFEVDQMAEFYVIQGNDGLWTMLGMKVYSNGKASPIVGIEPLSCDMVLSYYR